jgi:peptidoglycan/xylan/chitin deacetylase (PgdA/CDA1 family)
MYHEVPAAGEAGGYFSVARETFAAQLDRLRTARLDGASLERVLTGAAPGAVAITFDDGHATHARCATPELAARGMTATFFVVTDWVGRPGSASWPELREMAAAGMSIQSHTRSHPFLSELPRARVLEELRGSRMEIEDRLGLPVTTIALPNGDLPRAHAEDFAESGYRWVATSRWGANHGAGDAPRRIRRYTIRRSTTLADLTRLARAESSALAPEAVRLEVLGRLRAMVGPSRYARWRRAVLARAGTA